MNGGALGPLGGRGKWVPIKPATDGAFGLAMIRWIIENNLHNISYLSSPNLAVAKKRGFNSWTNACHLVIDDPKHPNNRKLLRAEDLGLTTPPLPEPDPKQTAPAKKLDYFITIDKASGKPAIYTDSQEGDITFQGELTVAEGRTVKVKTAFLIVKETAFSQELSAFAKDCGIPVETIIEIAQEFTSHGTKVGVDGMGNTAAANGMDGAWVHYVLCALVGAFYKKGGLIPGIGGASYKSFTPGPRYDLATYPGAQPVQGARISRTGFAFEKTSEYKKKVAAGQNPYPSKLPWFAFGSASDNQAIFSIVNNYPYQAKILINWMANPLLSAPAAARKEVLGELKKVERVPLFITIDAFMGEMSALADYIIPDTTQFESWGLPGIWSNFAGRATSLRWPVVKPMTPQIAEGRHACYENYLIDVAKKVGLPGFGDQAIPGADNTLYPLNNAEDLYLKAIANVAFDETVAPDILKEEIELQGLAELTNAWKNSLKPDEWAKVLYVMSRGGRFEKHGSGFIGDNYKYSNPGCFNLYSEALATAKNAYTGKPFSGVVGWNPEAFADGTLLSKAFPEDKWPFKGASYKAKFRSATMLANSVLREFNKTNYVEINTEEAKRFGLTDGDKVKVISATGAETSGILKVRPGIALGTIGVAFGYGHWEYGARAHQVGDKKLGGDATIGTGILLNAICLIDPTFKDSIYGFSEMSTGIPSRNGGAYRIEKI